MEPLRTAELLSIGTELTVGETRDTNAGDLARDLTRRGVVVGRVTALPDDLATVTAAFGEALGRADLVVSTGGLGPTPDDLTREAIAALAGRDTDRGSRSRGVAARPVRAAQPAVSRAQSEAGVADPLGNGDPERQRNGAGLVRRATGRPNRGRAPGTATGDAPDVGRLGPAAALEDRGLGRPIASVTLRLTGIGESAIAARLGSLLDAGSRPMVATYARADAVDIRIWAHDEPGRPVTDRPAADLVTDVEHRIVDMLGEHVWARGETSWPAAIAEALDVKGWRLAAAEVGMRGALLALLGEGLAGRLAFGETLAMRPEPHDGHRATLEHIAERVRELGDAEVGVAVEARERGGDTAVTVAVVTPEATHRETRVVFLGGSMGRGRAAIAAAAIVLNRLR